jgi:hypothetical protein
MAKRRVIQARKEDASRRRDDSLLLRSAESLGRVIGSLQRQVQGSSKRVSSMANTAAESLPDLPRLDNLFGDTARPARKNTAARKTAASRSKATSRKGARKSAGARKASGSRKRAGSRTSSKKR